jgi:hypothetical protein
MSDLYAARAVDTMLRTLGGRTVLLRIPAPAVPADVTEQLGLATPLFQDLPLGPVALRKSGTSQSEGKLELLVSAHAIQQLVGSLAFDSASILFSNACGIVIDDELFEIVGASAEQAFGQPYVYRLTLRTPHSRIV